MATRPREQPTALAVLRGRRVLICRPEPEASRLASAFEAVGASARTLPLMVREPLPETPEQRSILQDLDHYTHIIAVSPFAARCLLAAIDRWWPQIPTGVHWYGVGAGTAAEFQRHGLRPRMPANGWTSEALLALPSLQHLQHERVLLARGEHGRELIRDTLTQRGAQLTVLPLYRRYQPYYPSEQINDIFCDFQPEVIVALSGETLNNLNDICRSDPEPARRALVVVPAERVAEQAHNAGFHQVLVPEGLSDEQLIASVAARLNAGLDDTTHG
ncbi:MAG: uroporphyrinogen III synthase [Marinobacter sp. 34-60-7]|nr:MAG: uroporphyrinogen III synthase [Marinobacter sp. 34-60-7]